MASRMDGYIRVSQVAGRSGERFQSPTAQRDAIQGWASSQGVTIAAWHEDLDRSGGTMDRPGMNEALRRVREGVTAGIVVARLDRFARTVVGGLVTIRELHDTGARVVSVAEQLDPATPMGRAMLGLLLIMAEWHRDLADEHLGAAQHRAASAGRYPGRPSYGYTRTPRGQTIIDTAAAPVVRRIFLARANHAGWRRIADQLTADDVPSPTGRERWAPTTIQGIVHSEAYLGTFVGPRGLRITDAWPAVVDDQTWRRANEQTGMRHGRRNLGDRLLAGLARCAWCRHVLARTINPHGYVSYGCVTRGCQERTSIGVRLLDEHVAALIDERLTRVRLQPRGDDDEATRLRAARDTATRELEAWRDDLGLRGALGETDWRQGMLTRARARDDAETDLAAHHARQGLADVMPEGRVARFADLTREGQRRVALIGLHSVWVRRSPHRGPVARRHLADRVRVVWRDDPRPPALPSPARLPAGPLRW